MRLFAPFFILFWSAASVSAASPAADCGPQSRFVQELLGQQEWYRAVTETYRLAWSCPSSPATKNLDLELGRIYLSAGLAPLARNHLYSWLAENGRTDEDLLTGRMLLSQAYELDGDYENALYSLDKLPASPSRNLERARLRRAELRVKLLDPDRSREISDLAATLPSSWSNALRILREKDTESRALKKKSQILTAICGVIPGMNLVYCGKPERGLLNLTAQAGLGGIVTWAAVTERWPLVMVLSSTVISWYGYNFTAGRDACREYNEAVEKRFRSSWSLPEE